MPSHRGGGPGWRRACVSAHEATHATAREPDLIFDATIAGRTVRVEVRRANGRFSVTQDGKPGEIDFVETGRHFASLLIDGRSYEVGLERREDGYTVYFPEDTLEVQVQDAARGDERLARKADHGAAKLQAPMPGKILRVLAAAGQQVASGQGLLVMEAMKMENELRAPRDGRVREVKVGEGQAVESGALLVVLD